MMHDTERASAGGRDSGRPGAVGVDPRADRRPLGRDHRRRRAQRPDLRGLPGQGRPTGAGARGAATQSAARARSQEVWPGYRISPCAYLVGLLHPLVIDELEHGRATASDWYAGDGRAVRAVRGWRRASSSGMTTSCARRRSAGSRPATLTGWRAFCDVKRRLRDALRPAGDGDLWIGRAPSREEIERPARRRRRGPAAALRLVDGRVRRALHRGRAAADRPISARGSSAPTPARTTRARRRSTSTTSRAGWAGCPGMWGYVEGGMGMVSFILCDIARDAGRRRARPASPVARIIPGVGVELEGGERIDVAAASSRTPTRGRRSGCWATRPTPPGGPGSRRSRRSAARSS